ncbi:hypothetical protein LSCM1_02816 [Leishmania martiniquensis]|uniref:ABC transporter family-like protein n=1 Tax=Leishmania martiniquensis TaxID=1580590 RepID=A0A836GPV0_9TRYP|nr:hypothetical protein LSCM1_02816 [Leishmania martiniquensis]
MTSESPLSLLPAIFSVTARLWSTCTAYLREPKWQPRVWGRVPLSATVLVLAAVVSGLRLSKALCFGNRVYLRQRVLLLARIRAFVLRWEGSCLAEVEACCADVDGQAAAVLARYMGCRSARRFDAWWRASVTVDVSACPPPLASSSSFFGIVPSMAFSHEVVLEDMLELAYVADSVLRLAEDRRWLQRFVVLLQYVLLRRVSQMEEVRLYRRWYERALFPRHSPTQRSWVSLHGEQGTQHSTWAAAWRLYHRPTWLAPLPGGSQFLCLPLSYFPVEAVLPYVARETWLSDRLLSTMLPRWEHLCVWSLRQRHKSFSAVPALTSGTRAERMSVKIHYWFLRYTAPLLRACVEQQRADARCFCIAELSTAAGCSGDTASGLPRGSLVLLWRCLVSSCTCHDAAPSAGSPPVGTAAQNKETTALVRRVLILRAFSQAVVVTLQVCCPRLSVRYVTEVAVAGYCAQRGSWSLSAKATTVEAAAASPVQRLLSSMASDMGWALLAGVAEVLLTRFTGLTGHQLSQLLAEAATRRLQQELLCVDEAFCCRWLRATPGEGDGVATNCSTASPWGRMSPGGMLPARQLITVDDVLAVGRRGGERVFALHDAVVKRSLQCAALLCRAAVTREWRPLVGAAVTAWVDPPRLLSSFSVAVGYSTPSEVARLLSRKEESLPTRSPVGLRLLLEILVDEESDTVSPPVWLQRRRRRLRRPYLSLVMCSRVWTFEHLLRGTNRSVANLRAHVCRLKDLYAAVCAHPYAAASVKISTTAADAIASMQEDARCVLYYSVYQMERTWREWRCGDADGAVPPLHPLLDPEETVLLQHPSALSYLPAHVDYFDLFSLPYRFVLRQLGLEMVFAYRTAAGMQQESRQMAEEWWMQTLFHSTFNPLTSALHEVVQLAASCATVLLLCSQLVDGMLLVCPLPLPALLQKAHAIQTYRDLLRSGVALQRLEDGVAPLQQLCECLPHSVLSEAATLLRPSSQDKGPLRVSHSELQRRRRVWRQVLTASRPELCFDGDDRIVGGLRLFRSVSWHHVYFTYPQLFVAPGSPLTGRASTGSGCSVRPTLTDVCFACPAVGMTAVVGPSGAGKSSLNLLLRRLYDPVAVVECDHGNGTAWSPPDEHRRMPLDLNRVGAVADAEDVLVEVLRLALVEGALPPPCNCESPQLSSLHSVTHWHANPSQPSPSASAPLVNSQRYRLRVKPGYIALDGIPLTLFSATYLRQWLGWLPQTPQVRPHQSFLSIVRSAGVHVTMCDVQRALRLCGCDAFLQKNHRSFRDAVGPLSSGESQRLALASVVAIVLARTRVELLHGMPLRNGDGGTATAAAAVGGLVLDEPTSKLDAANEQHLLGALAALQVADGSADSGDGSGLRLFTWMVSHRMSSLQSARHMLVVEDGRVTASGPSASVTKANRFAKTQLQLQQLPDASLSRSPRKPFSKK